MHTQLIITSGDLAELARRLTALPTRLQVCDLGLSADSVTSRYLVSGIRGDEPDRDAMLEEASRHLVVASLDVLASTTASRWSIEWGGAVFVLAIGLGAHSGRVAVQALGDDVATLDELVIVGPRHSRITLRRSARPREVGARQGRVELSRFEGALGVEPVAHLGQMRVTVAGVGRGGSLVASSVAPYVSTTILVDHDRLELHSVLDMAGAGLADVGRQKVAAVGDALRARTNADVLSVPRSVLSLDALFSIKTADFILAWPDSDAARLGLASLAAVYLKPVIYVGTGIFDSGHRSAATGRLMGADVRLVVPDRCLVCSGSVNRLERARAELLGDGERVEPGDWRTERAGSLRSLNTVAAGLAHRLLEDYVAGTVDRSIWLRLEYDRMGIPSVTQIPLPEPRRCSFCDALRGRGDAGLARIRDALLAI